MDIHFDWQACGSSVKICVWPAQWIDFALQGFLKNIHDFQSSQANIHPSIFSSSRSFSARVLLATQWPQTPTTLIHPRTPLMIYMIICINIYIIYIYIRQHVQHVNNGNVFPNVSEVLVRNVNIPPPTPLMNIRRHVQHVDNILTTATCSLT